MVRNHFTCLVPHSHVRLKTYRKKTYFHGPLYVNVFHWLVVTTDLWGYVWLSLFCTHDNVFWGLPEFIPFIKETDLRMLTRDSICNLRSGSTFVSLWILHSGGQDEAVRENVWEPLKLGLTSGYSICKYSHASGLLFQKRHQETALLCRIN